MKHLLLIGASALLLSTLVPQTADAQAGFRRGVRPGVVGRRGVVAVRPGFRRGYAYRGGRGWGPAAAVGVLGAAAVGAAVAAPYYGGAYGGYADPCLRQQQVINVYGYPEWQTVNVC
jgi:hypothetical protein